jgi:uncharacterized protein (DUF1330 family)
MPAYVIADIDVHDPERYAAYREESTATVAEHGGRWLVRGGRWEVAEGDWRPARLVVIEFPDAAAAWAWYRSDRYRAAAEVRRAASTGSVVVVEGA